MRRIFSIYKMTVQNCNILQGKRGLVFGALDERSLAWHVATRCVECGADIVLTNTPQALQLGTLPQLAKEAGWPVVPCDATDIDDIRHLLGEAQALLGGPIDFVLHSVAQSMNLRRHRTYEKVNYDYFLKTLDISALSLHKILQTALEMNAIRDGGSVVTLTYLASERYLYGYNDMADAKAMLESVVRQMGAIYGIAHGVRVNAVSQSATNTKAGTQWDEQACFARYVDDLSPLGSADADACADLCVSLFSDLTRKVTMQTIYNDGGFSRTMLTGRLMSEFRNAIDNKNDITQ